MSLREECSKDELMETLYEDLITNNNVMTYREMIITMRFFISFSMGCRRLGIFDVSDKMNWRLNTFITMLKEKGYRSGARRSHGKDYGFDDILNRAFALNYERLWG